MSAYSELNYFLYAFIAVAPAVILGLKGKNIGPYRSLLSICFILLTCIVEPNQGVWIVTYVIAMYMLLITQVKYPKKTWFYRLVLVLAIVPVFLVKMETILGFLGISYITFKMVGMIFEIRDGLIKKLNISSYLSFVLFFPTFTSGPIDRFRRYDKENSELISKEQYGDMVYQGINLIFQGLLYKFIIAFLIERHLSGLDYVEDRWWLYMYVYSLKLFFDFAGYSVFAIAFSKFLGINTPKNFDKPFISRNIKDFWNRWHMSLSFWFRDYVFMRFVLWLTKKKVIKNKLMISSLGYILLFVLMGVWHGIEWHYIVYGLYHAGLFIGFDVFDKWNKKLKFWKNNWFFHSLGIAITFHAIAYGFLIFSGYLFK